MKNKKGYTLIELLGVIVLLSILSSLGVVVYTNFMIQREQVYYKELEESMLLAGGEYYTFNKSSAPLMFGDEKKVTLSYLKNNIYTEGEIKDARNNSCDLEESYVGAYKDSIDKTNYYVCLVCGDYHTENLACQRDLDYTLTIKNANKKITTTAIATNKAILNFETLNDMDKVVLENNQGDTETCTLKDNNGLKSCSLEVKETGNYQVYGKTGSNSSRIKEIKVLIK